MDQPKPIPPTTIEPALALELRIRWLEALLLGVKQDPSARDRKGKEKAHEVNFKTGESLTKMVEDLQRGLDAVVEGNEGLKRFINHCTWYRVSLVYIH